MMTRDELDNFATLVGNKLPDHFSGPYWLEWFAKWAEGEGTNARYNPLATTQKMPNSTPFNSAGVQNYASLADGVQATVWSIDPRIYGGIDYYPHIRAAISAQSIDGIGRADVATEIRRWGTTPFAVAIEGGWNPTAPVTPPPLPPHDLDLNTVLQLRMFLTRLANFADEQVVARAVALLRVNGYDV